MTSASDPKTQLAELLGETEAEFILNDVSGGAKARYVRIYFASFYRFEDVTEMVMSALALPLVRAEGMHTAAIYSTDAEFFERIVKAVAEVSPAPSPVPRNEADGPSGGQRVKVRKPTPTRPPRRGALVPTK